MDVVLMMIRGETIKYCSARKKRKKGEGGNSD